MAEYQSPGAAFGDTFSGALEHQQALKRQAMLDQLAQQKEAREAQTHQQTLGIEQQRLNMEMEKHKLDLAEKTRLNDSKIQADREKVGKETVAGVDEHFAPGDIVPPSTAAGVRANAPGIMDTLFKPQTMPSTLPGTSVPVEPAESGNLIARGTADQRAAALKLGGPPKPPEMDKVLRSNPGRTGMEMLENGQWVPVTGDVPKNHVVLAEPQPKPEKDTTARDLAAAARTDAETNRIHTGALNRMNKFTTPIEAHIEKADEAIKMINAKSPAADVLVAPLVIAATISGQGSGFRMTRAEIENVTGGRSGWEDLKAKLQHWNQDPSQALSITPEQRVQLYNLMKAARKAANDRLQKTISAQREMDEAKSAKDIFKIETKLQGLLNPPEEEETTTTKPSAADLIKKYSGQ